MCYKETKEDNNIIRRMEGWFLPKYYAVKTGKKPGIYNTWEEAEAQVKGVSNAKYKSFKSEQEALEYIGLNRNDNQVFDERYV